MSRRTAGRRAAFCLAWAALAATVVQAQNPTPVAPSAPVYPNLLFEVSKDFANALTRTQSQTVTTPINTNKDKVQTTGSQTTRITANVEFVESAQYGRVELKLQGLTTACTDSQRGRVYLGNAVQLSTWSQKTVIVDENGIHEYVAQTQPHLDMNQLRYLNTGFRFPIDPLVRRIAYKAYNKQKPKLEADITKQAGDEMTKQFNEKMAEKVKDLNARYVDDFKKPMSEKGIFPQRIRVLSSDHQFGIRMLLNDPTGKARSFAPVPEIHGWPDIAVRVEESLLNNFSHGMFAGKTFTGEELDDEFNRLIGPLIGPVKTIEAGDKPFSITFPKQKPIEFHFYDQKFKITLRGEEYTSGDRDFDGMDTTAVYKLRKTDTGFIAEREGDLVIYPPGFKPGVDKLGAREKVLQQLLDRKFSKVFKPVFEMKEAKLPEAFRSAGTLISTQVDSNKGWLTIGLRLKP